MKKQKTKREILKAESFKRFRDMTMSDVYHYVAWQINCKTAFYGRRLTQDEYCDTVISAEIAYERRAKLNG